MKIVRWVKSHIKQVLIHRQHKRYEELLAKEKNDYHEWIRRKESNIKPVYETGQRLGTLSYEECGAGLLPKIAGMQKDIVIFHSSLGQLSAIAKPLIGQYMAENPMATLLYGDEDRMVKTGKTGGIHRENPWFKPDWSPDTFLSSFYFGSLFAVRRKDALEILQKMQERGEISESPARNRYQLCKGLAEASGGFQKRPPGISKPFPVGHISEVLFHGTEEPVIEKGCFQEEYGVCEEAFVSVIIPSKDHPAILKRCILSFLEHTDHLKHQFIIVDNGSKEKNKKEIEEFLQTLNQEGRLTMPPIYDYHPAPFNFSRMCNRGGQMAAKESQYLLFLNDDMEICQDGWLKHLIGKAVLPRVGAVGAKLLYPESDIIQHAGVTNLRIGPAHKLQYLSDRTSHYFGRNRGVHNAAAVTGACLMIRKSVFAEIGGFSEELAVAFNDVDLCYSLWEAGYVNVVLNDIVLFHHESLSRGNDGESEEKRARLQKEHGILYHRHLGIYARDPWYHKYLLTDLLIPEYVPASHYEMDLGMPWSEILADEGKMGSYPVDACLRLGIESAVDVFRWKYGIGAEELGEIPEDLQKGGMPWIAPEDMGLCIQGYSFVIGADNACYERFLLMKDIIRETIWKIPVADRYRGDIKAELPDQLNVDLTGFMVKVRTDALPSGTYQIGMMVKDRCSRQRLVNWSDWELGF